MRRVLYLLLLAALFLVPQTPVELSKLAPVEVVAVWREGENTVLKTDTDAGGVGADVTEALADLKANSPGVIYLETAAYLLVGEGCETEAEQLRPFLRGNVRVVPYRGGDLKTEAAIADRMKE